MFRDHQMTQQHESTVKELSDIINENEEKTEKLAELNEAKNQV